MLESMKKSLNFFQAVLCELGSERDITIVQVGVCDGAYNDPLYPLVRTCLPNVRLILIEPQTWLKPIIEKNYEFLLNPPIIETVAVGEPGELSLYYMKQDYVSQVTKVVKGVPAWRLPAGSVSANKAHLKQRLADLLPPEIDLDSAIATAKVPCVSLGQILKKHDIEEYDVLQIDTESCDDVTIFNSSLELVSPKIINFEYCHLGIRMAELVDYLEGLGYRTITYSGEDAIALKSTEFDVEKLWSEFSK